MPRTEVNAVETIGNDSFLDVVTNVVGILIVLVIVAGLQAGRAMTAAATAAVESELAEPKAKEKALATDIRRLDAERQNVQATTTARDAERLFVATEIEMRQQELNARRNLLDASQREQLDLKRALADAQAELTRQGAERDYLRNGKAPTIELKAFSTPISKTVLGKQVHCRLSKGCLAMIPLDDLVEEAKQSVRRHQWKPEDMRGFLDEVGPIGGFRMRFAVEVEVDSTRTRAMMSIKEWQLVPESWQVGEPVAKAVQPQSEFRTALAGLDPSDTTITVWTYPESFAEYRQVTNTLHELGFAVAGRPLPDGIQIAGSSRGTRSAAQ
jgi:hypothetical protein